MSHVVDGLSNESIAKQLGISPKTIETHRARINKKLRCNNPVQVFRLCFLAELLGRSTTGDVALVEEHLEPVVDQRRLPRKKS